MPRVVNMRDKIPVVNQHQEGACNGFAMRAATVVNHLLASGGTFQEFSGDGLYYMCQRVDGISGDKGSTVSGGTKVLKDTGALRIEDFPTTPAYDPRRLPSNAGTLAAPYRVESAAILRSVSEIKDWIGRNIGGCWYGCSWGFTFDGQGNAVRWSTSGGGHATAICGYDDTRGHFDCLNSWGASWQGQGWYTVPYEMMERILRDQYTVVAGTSDMSEIKPRVFNWSDRKGMV
jgi:hypothetical protein